MPDAMVYSSGPDTWEIRPDNVCVGYIKESSGAFSSNR